MWIEMSSSIRKVTKEILGDSKDLGCKPRKVGSGVRGYKKQLSRNEHI